MTPGQFATLIAYTESDDNPHAWGDDDRALGLYQAHPDWAITYAKRYNIWPLVGEKWNDWIGNLVCRFFVEYSQTFTDTEVAMHYHLGHESLASNVDWDAVYAARFNYEASKLSIAAT